MVIGVYAAIRTGLFTPDKAFEVVVRKQIASLKAPTDIVVRLVTEEVLKICQEGVAQVNAGTGSFSLGTALHRHVMFLRTKSTAFLSISIFPCTGPPTTILIGFLGLISNLTLHASHPPFSSLSLPACNQSQESASDSSRPGKPSRPWLRRGSTNSGTPQ